MPKAIFFQHQFLDNLLDTQGFYKSPPEKDAALHFASRSRFQELYGSTAEYAPDKPLPRRAYQLTQNITDTLQPFLRELVAFPAALGIPQLPKNFPLNMALSASNDFKLPEGWVHPTAMEYIKGGELSLDDDSDLSEFLFPVGSVKLVNDDAWGRRMRSKTAGPTPEYPIARALKNGYRFSPAGIVHITYLGLPPKPFFATTPNTATGNADYDDSASVDMGWPETEHNIIVLKAAEVLGVPMQDSQLMNFARYKAQAEG